MRASVISRLNRSPRKAAHDSEQELIRVVSSQASAVGQAYGTQM